jgi:hypothetical protein
LALGLAVLIVVTMVIVKWTFNIFDKLMPLGPPAAPFTQSRQTPSGPMIQATPHLELKDYCAAQVKNVETYSWVDQQRGIVRIPIDRAMDMILQQGLPARASSASPANGVSGNGAASSAPPSDGSPANATPASDLPGVTVGAQNTQAASYLEGPCGYLADPAVNAPKD